MSKAPIWSFTSAADSSAFSLAVCDRTPGGRTAATRSARSADGTPGSAITPTVETFPSSPDQARTWSIVAPRAVAPPTAAPPSPKSKVPTMTASSVPARVAIPTVSPTSTPLSSAFCRSRLTSPRASGRRPSTVSVGSNRSSGYGIDEGRGSPRLDHFAVDDQMAGDRRSSPCAASTPGTPSTASTTSAAECRRLERQSGEFLVRGDD